MLLTSPLGHVRNIAVAGQMGAGVGQKKKKKLREKLADCVASVTNAVEPGIAANLFLSVFFLLLSCVFFFFVSARRLSSSQVLIKKPARVSRGAPDGSFKSFVCYCLMTRRF